MCSLNYFSFTYKISISGKKYSISKILHHVKPTIYLKFKSSINTDMATTNSQVRLNYFFSLIKNFNPLQTGFIKGKDYFSPHHITSSLSPIYEPDLML